MTPARDHLGRLLDVPEDSSPEEIAEAVARLDTAEALNLATLRRYGRHNLAAPGWH